MCLVLLLLACDKAVAAAATRALRLLRLVCLTEESSDSQRERVDTKDVRYAIYRATVIQVKMWMGEAPGGTPGPKRWGRRGELFP